MVATANRMPRGDGTLTFELALSSIWIPANGGFLISAAGAALEVVDATWHGYLLDASGTESVSAQFMCPPGWSKVNIDYYGYNATADEGGICLGYYMQDKSDGGSLVSETPTAVADVVFTAGAEDTLKVNQGARNVAVTPDAIHSLKVSRIHDNAGDTKTGDYGLLGVRLTRAA